VLCFHCISPDQLFGLTAWLGHVMRMDEKRTPKRILEWKPIGRRIGGRPRKRWIEDVEEIYRVWE